MRPNEQQKYVGMLFASYARNSSNMQNPLGLDDQFVANRRKIEGEGGRIFKEYRDGAESGWNGNREGLKELIRDAQSGLFDGVILWSSDRLARDFVDAVKTKSYLRDELGLKLVYVHGASADDGGDLSYTMENLETTIGADYSIRLSKNTKRGKLSRAERGEFNGSIPPFGYDLKRKKDLPEAQHHEAGLYPNEAQAAIVKTMFEMYASGKHSATTIAEWLNALEYVKGWISDKSNSKPFGSDTVRDMLNNRVYTGKVAYAPTRYSGEVSGKKKSVRGRKIWFDGKHEAIVDEQLFEDAQMARERLRKRRNSPQRLHDYVLRDKMYCSRCMVAPNFNVQDPKYGLMRAHWNNAKNRGEYRCLARDKGYTKCCQGYVVADSINWQVYSLLRNLTIPYGLEERITEALEKNPDTQESMDRIAKLVTRQEALMKDMESEDPQLPFADALRVYAGIQHEIEKLIPFEREELDSKVDLIRNFQTYWLEADKLDSTKDARFQLLDKIVRGVFVHDKCVIAVALYAEFAVIFGGQKMHFFSVKSTLEELNAKGAAVDCALDGSDGIRTRDLHLDRVAC